MHQLPTVWCKLYQVRLGWVGLGHRKWTYGQLWIEQALPCTGDLALPLTTWCCHLVNLTTTEYHSRDDEKQIPPERRESYLRNIDCNVVVMCQLKRLIPLKTFVTLS